MYQCVRCTVWIKAYASKLALGGFQCSGLSVSDFPELRFPRTRIFIVKRRPVTEKNKTHKAKITSGPHGLVIKSE